MAKYEYQLIPGFFVQDDHAYSATHQIVPSFGLLNPTDPDRWAEFKKKVAALHEGVKARGAGFVKVFFVGRHGQGWHNLAAAKYGREEWDTKWCKLNGDGEITWGPDPELTPQGIQEAKNASEAWKKELPHGMPLPNRWFASPFQRASNTLRITFDGVVADPKPLIIEEIREMIGMHTCDKRSPKRTIQERFPTFSIEEGFTEEDELWKPDYRETEGEMVVRAARGLDKIMELTDVDDVYISISAHTGIARALMAAVGHRRYDLPTGGVLPMVVSVTRT
ncbi:phosphoglycerate mutase [Calocera cornea HHB12733]|uniref:Phosphoglycerate mutase n=1 Tax=Calocera cornea HHB12733 TaxID=1353952 RepID=A0A165HIK5_9BASI|nr:phosphoglycerate mutase [Calocera cornea HHB12733]